MCVSVLKYCTDHVRNHSNNKRKVSNNSTKAYTQRTPGHFLIYYFAFSQQMHNLLMQKTVILFFVVVIPWFRWMHQCICDIKLQSNPFWFPLSLSPNKWKKNGFLCDAILLFLLAVVVFYLKNWALYHEHDSMSHSIVYLMMAILGGFWINDFTCFFWSIHIFCAICGLTISINFSFDSVFCV